MQLTLTNGTNVGAHLGSGVDVGPNSVLLGPIEIGAHARIGAGSVLLRDIPPAATAAGNPARVLPTRGDTPC